MANLNVRGGLIKILEQRAQFIELTHPLALGPLPPLNAERGITPGPAALLNSPADD